MCDKTQMVTKYQTKIVTKNQDRNCEIFFLLLLNCDKIQIQKLKLLQNSKTQNLTKLKNSSSDKTQKLKLQKIQK